MKPTHLHHDLRCRKTIPFVLLATALASSAWGQSPVTIQNPGFEDPVISSDGGYQSAPVPGWATFNGGNTGVLNPSSAGDLTDEAPEGANVGLITSSSSEDGLSQVLSSALIADAQYALTLKVANTKLTTGFPGYRVQLVAGGTVIAEDDNSQSIAEDVIATSTVNYTYDVDDAGLVGQPLEIRLLSKGLSSGEEVAFDDVQLTVALGNPVADPGGPYTVSFGGSLSLDGSGSLPSDGATITTWEWDLDNDGLFNEAITGATPASITHADLQSTYGMIIGANTIKLRVTDDSSPTPKTSTVEGTVTLGPSLVIYEPFDDLDPTLAGNTPGLGLTGTWNPGESFVEDGSLLYGRLAYSGGRVVTNPGDQFDVNGVSPGTTLADAGLLDDGATLWFSCLIVKAAQVSTSGDRRIYVSLGTGAPDGFDRIGGNGGSGLCVAVNKTSNGVEARGWNNNSDGVGGAFSGGVDTSVADGDTFLAVGKITWGAYDPTKTSNPDVFELYLPDEDLNLGTPVSTLNCNFDQDGTANAANLFNTIGIAGGRPQNFVPEVDEIRFGATYDSVTPRDESAPVIVSTDPVDDSPAGNGAQQIATFDEPIFVGTGNIRLVNDTDTVTTTIPVGDPQVVVSGNTLTITPTGGLVGNKAYHIEIDAGAVKNFNEIDFAGISDPTVWNFIADGTPPTVASITDSVSPLPLLTATSVTYTVTFDEPIDAATVDIGDFANTTGSASVTIDSVTATANPAVYEVVVSASSPGTLTLEIVSGAVITDLPGNPLDTTSAVLDDTTITVNDPTPTAATLVNDFQATIASEQHPTYPDEARYFHVSVNPANPGTGSYAATIVGTNDPAPRFVRNYTGPVEAYWFGGGANSVLNAGMTGGPNPGIISFTTEDDEFDGFAQAQAKVWDATDPGADLATGGPGTGTSDLPWIASADKNSGMWRSLGGAVGTIDISALASGSIHIYYGSFSATPSVRVTMKDTDNVAADIVLADVHSIAGGGNGDAADRAEYYLAEIDFDAAGFYDEIEFEWLANGTDYLGNGRGIGVVVTGPDVVATDPFADWSVLDGATGVTFEGDANGDGVQDGLAFLLGAANPNVDANTAGLLPTVAETAAGLELSFNALPIAARGTAKLYVQHSTDLFTWTTSPTGVEVPDAPGGGPTDNVTFVVGAGPAGPPALNSVTATIDATAAGGGGKLFGRLQATEE